MVQADHFIKRYLASYKPYKDGRWCYEDGCILKGCIDLYEATGDESYRDFVLHWLDRAVLDNGDIPGFDSSQYSIDDINPGKSLFFALDQTGNAKYRKALDFHYQRLMAHPRCKCGSFWHKDIYPWQIWQDGLYMAQPFYAAYTLRYTDADGLDDVLTQFRNVRTHLFDQETMLHCHGWDESRQQPWCDPLTGRSHNFWLRACGWYVMALADCLALLVNDSHQETFEELSMLLQEAIEGLLRYQDQSGLFWQVINHPSADGNYLETSGSAMIACAMMRGARCGALGAEYAVKGKEVFSAILREKLITENGVMHLKDICSVAGLGPGSKRNGSIAYYLSEPVVSDDAKGVGPWMMALAEYTRLEG